MITTTKITCYFEELNRGAVFQREDLTNLDLFMKTEKGKDPLGDEAVAVNLRTGELCYFNDLDNVAHYPMARALVHEARFALVR